eukprot:9503851-Pyramimonas_sp.AAC.6
MKFNGCTFRSWTACVLATVGWKRVSSKRGAKWGMCLIRWFANGVWVHLEQVQDKVYKCRIRIKEFFSDFDKLRCGYISQAQVRMVVRDDTCLCHIRKNGTRRNTFPNETPMQRLSPTYFVNGSSS